MDVGAIYTDTDTSAASKAAQVLLRPKCRSGGIAPRKFLATRAKRARAPVAASASAASPPESKNVQAGGVQVPALPPITRLVAACDSFIAAGLQVLREQSRYTRRPRGNYHGRLRDG